MKARAGWRIATAVVALLATSGCVAVRGDSLPRPTYAPIAGGAPGPPVDYTAQFIGGTHQGATAFAARVELVFAWHPILAAARPGTEAPLHVDLTLTNRTNKLPAILTGLASGFTFMVLPAYARDDFDLEADVRAGGELRRHFAYHASVVTIVQVFLALTPPAAHPRAVVEDVVDDLLVRLLLDLDASGALAAP